MPGEAPSALPVRELERYRRQVAPTLDRLRLQQPLLMSVEGSEPQTVDRVQLAAEEFERLRQELIGIKSPESLRAQHDMLFQSTTLALMAMRLTLEAVRTTDPATLRNAASAAAGATLLLDRACADLGCPDPRSDRLLPLLRAGDDDSQALRRRRRRTQSGDTLRNSEGLRPDADAFRPGTPPTYWPTPCNSPSLTPCRSR